MEVGSINITHTITNITLNNSFVDPVVIALPSSYNGSHEATVRIDQVSGTGFSLFLEEPINRDGPHTSETVHYVVIEKGSYTFPDGTTLEAGSRSSSNLSFQTVTLLESYSTAPTILTQIQTDNSSSRFLHTRQLNPSGTSFEVKLEREESRNTTSPSSSEVIGYFAIEKRLGSLDGVAFEAGSFSASNSTASRSFVQSFSSGLHCIATIATYNGSDPATLRWNSLSTNAYQAFVDEDVSSDSETNHSSETIDFFAIDDNSGAGIFLNTSLDIELLSFEAKILAPQMAELKWITTSKIEPNDNFEVEQSKDGVDWEKIQIVNAPFAWSNDRVTFKTTVSITSGAASFFRLKLIDADGTSSYSPIREVANEKGLQQLRIYPTLATTELTATGIDIDEFPFQIFDYSGQNRSKMCQYKKVGPTEFCIDVTLLPSGYYLIKIGDEVRKFLKN